MKGSRPFPHAVDAILLGCQREDYIEARVVYVPATNEIFANASLLENCSP
jgi:hypothetical protein